MFLTMTKELQTKRITQVLWLIAITLFLQVYLSYNLWFPIDRTYPIVPFFDGLTLHLGNGLTRFVSGAMLCCILSAALSVNYRKWLLPIALFGLAILILNDLNRLQVWIFIYIGILGILAMHAWQKVPTPMAWRSLQFIVAVVYFWTGTQKLNAHFNENVYSWLIGIFESTAWLKDNYLSTGYLVGTTELLIGLALFWRKTQKVAVIAVAALHTSILLLLIKYDAWNTVVYPWNIAMIVLVVLLFWQSQQSIVEQKTKRPAIWVLVLFGFAPILDFGGYWMHELSFGMYSGISLEGQLYFDDYAADDCVPEVFWADDLLYQSKEESALSLDDWAMENLNVPPISTPYAFRTAAKEFCTCLDKHHWKGGLELEYTSRWSQNKRKILIPMKEL